MSQLINFKLQSINIHWLVVSVAQNILSATFNQRWMVIKCRVCWMSSYQQFKWNLICLSNTTDRFYFLLCVVWFKIRKINRFNKRFVFKMPKSISFQQINIHWVLIRLSLNNVHCSVHFWHSNISICWAQNLHNTKT